MPRTPAIEEGGSPPGRGANGAKRRSASHTARNTASFWVSAAFALAFITWTDAGRLQAIAGGDGTGWLRDMNLDSTPYIIVMLLLPICYLRIPIPKLGEPKLGEIAGRFGLDFSQKAGRSRILASILAVFIAATSLAASLSVANRSVEIDGSSFRISELPALYHDEHSYLFQARTFLAGRWSFPSHPTHPRLFDQMHVVNQGRFASRYPPATGAWIAPFLALGHPYLGHWLAGSLIAVLIFAAGRELGGNGVGFIAGITTASSPGIAVFSNYLLAHHPALLGLSLFLYLYLRMLRTGRAWCAALAGVGLAFAMLARPMTAFGFGLPFGLAFLGWLPRRSSRERLRLATAMGVPLLCGFAILGLQNRAITGDWLTSPYQQFNEVYTPRHIYGFGNVERAEQRIEAGEVLTNDVFEAYDRWAENLTPRRALENVRKRAIATGQWTLAIVPLSMAGIFFLGSGNQRSRRWWLIPAAILSLHAVHIPYWLDGMAHWHYVFETAPLWLLIYAAATRTLFESWRRSGRSWMPVWWSLSLVIALATGHVTIGRFWKESRVDSAVASMAFAKTLYYRFDRVVSRRVLDERALLLIQADPGEIHFEYINNLPDLNGPQQVLFGRYRPESMSLDDIIEAFPERAAYLWDVEATRFERLSSRHAAPPGD